MSEVALTLRKIFHRGSYRTGLLFAHNPVVNARLKTLGAGYGSAHNLKQGLNLRFIQELPGHDSSKTTEIYMHGSQKHLQ